jgi:hypothetical protein
VTGFLHRTPLLSSCKGKGVTSPHGRKNSIPGLNAVRSAMAEIGRALRFVMMLADEETEVSPVRRI